MAEEKWALVSVYNKPGIEEYVRRLVKMGWKIISTDGTAKKLTEAGIPVRDVAELVGGGAILGKRVKTLSREVHSGLLADPEKPKDMEELMTLGIPFIDMVICDFYPIRRAIAEEGATIESVIELTDIGGPCMVRSAAKGGRIVVCRVSDRELVLKELESTGSVSKNTRQKLRARAEFEVAKYVLDSARFHGNGEFEGFMGERIASIPKGENGPQSPAALYETCSTDVLALSRFQIIAGQPLSYNNYVDLDRLLQTMTHIGAAWRRLGSRPCIAIIVKHGNPCGAGVGKTELEAVTKAAKGDSLAAFGGLVMTNFAITQDIAHKLVTAGMKKGQIQKFDSVIAPAFGKGVDEFLARKGGRCRLVINPAIEVCWSDLDFATRFRYARSNFLTQPNYTFVLDLMKAEVASGNRVTRRIEEDVLLAWAICATSNSNTITVVKNRTLLVNGVGQQSRLWAAKLVKMRGKDTGHEKQLLGSVACSDSFFPYDDAVLVLINAGVTTIFTTSGSQIGDKKVRALCQKRGIQLLMMPDAEARGFFGH